jgi:tripeptidyl-peptidase-1
MILQNFNMTFRCLKDLVAFWKKYPPVVPTMYTYNPTDQPHTPAGDESSLDVQYLPACGAGITSQHWYTAGRQPGNAENEPFVAWLTNVASTPNDDVPDLFSISYGDEEHGVTESYAVRCNTEFQSAGVRGITLLAASGDSGAGCSLGAYVPTFPASSPYITGVGGLEGGSAGRHPTGEQVAHFSGGGFSNYFSRPSFQDTAVAAYLKQSSVPSTRLFNKDGAGFPDISAQAVQFDVVTDGFFFPLDGTSCACPTAAGLFGLLNQDRLDAGKSKLGFLNPMLYAGAAGGFNDIESGYNDYCGNPSAFPATKGWDAVTGFGSPDYPSLKTYVLSLP